MALSFLRQRDGSAAGRCLPAKVMHLAQGVRLLVNHQAQAPAGDIEHCKIPQVQQAQYAAGDVLLLAQEAGQVMCTCSKNGSASARDSEPDTSPCTPGWRAMLGRPVRALQVRAVAWC